MLKYLQDYLQNTAMALAGQANSFDINSEILDFSFLVNNKEGRG